jgi:hypothetical protein
MKTKILKIKGDWEEVVNDCRVTVKKSPLGHEPSKAFRKKILLAEHSPIRDIIVKFAWMGIPYWVAMHWKTHHWESRVDSQRNDRQTRYDREEAPQKAPVDFYGDPNAQPVQGGSGGDEDGGFGGGGGAPGGFGGDMGGGDMLGDLGEPGSMEDGEIGGEEGSAPMDEDMPMESKKDDRPVINEVSNVDVYLEYLKSLTKEKEEHNIIDKTRIITESIDENMSNVLNVVKD